MSDPIEIETEKTNQHKQRCPNCKADLRKVGFGTELSNASISFKWTYNPKTGVFDNKFDQVNESDDEYVCCGACDKEIANAYDLGLF